MLVSAARGEPQIHRHKSATIPGSRNSCSALRSAKATGKRYVEGGREPLPSPAEEREGLAGTDALPIGKKPPFHLCNVHPRVQTHTNACILQGRLAPFPSPTSCVKPFWKAPERRALEPAGDVLVMRGEQSSRARWDSQVRVQGPSHPIFALGQGGHLEVAGRQEHPISEGFGEVSESLTPPPSASGSWTRTPKINREGVAGRLPRRRRGTPASLAERAGRGSSRPRRHNRQSASSDYKSQDSSHSAAPADRGCPWQQSGSPGAGNPARSPVGGGSQSDLTEGGTRAERPRGQRSPTGPTFRGTEMHGAFQSQRGTWGEGEERFTARAGEKG